MIYVPPIFKPIINTVYPPNNAIEFERWLGENFKECNTDREYLDIYWTGYYVNNEYGNNHESLQRLTVFLNDLPRDKKYFTCVQYDDGILNNVSHLDLLQFNMSKNVGYPLPLISQPHPYPQKHNNDRFFFSFIGKRTHPIRDIILNKGNNGSSGEINLYYMCTDADYDIESYCGVLSNSVFGLCPRGYGINSFRVRECLQYGAIPVVISDKFIIPHNYKFENYGVLIDVKYADSVAEILSEIPPKEIYEKQKILKEVHDKYYTYESNLNLIIKHIEAEYNLRKQNGAIADIDKRIEIAGSN